MSCLGLTHVSVSITRVRPSSIGMHCSTSCQASSVSTPGVPAGSAVMNYLFLLSSLWVVSRLGRMYPLLLFGAVLLALRHFGPYAFVDNWGVAAIIFPTLGFVILTANVATGRLSSFPLAALAAVLITQNHLSTIVLVATLLPVALIAGVYKAHRTGYLAERGKYWLAIGIVIFLVAYAPPLYEELRPGQGNITKILKFFGQPHQDAPSLEERGRVSQQLLFGASGLTPERPVAAGSLLLVLPALALLSLRFKESLLRWIVLLFFLRLGVLALRCTPDPRWTN